MKKSCTLFILTLLVVSRLSLAQTLTVDSPADDALSTLQIEALDKSWLREIAIHRTASAAQYGKPNLFFHAPLMLLGKESNAVDGLPAGITIEKAGDALLLKIRLEISSPAIRTLAINRLLNDPAAASAIAITGFDAASVSMKRWPITSVDVRVGDGICKSNCVTAI